MKEEDTIRSLKIKERCLVDLQKKIMHPKDPQSASVWRKRYLNKCREDLILETRLPFVRAVSNLDLKRSPGSVKSLAAWASKRRETPIVCSWELCEAGSVVDAGRLFSKCANCSLAYYCSKDHQKKHWPSHKQHCKLASSTIDSLLEG
ncbi:hypothetical protein KFL_006620070 [Klebsormidium nitens]|uniref:MYND-type domain-containing protein n=1 Tax=Klebsormidium nitens TaxID=105231 RepID=A0A1Y1IKF4_KLENI|nr:hypothetical protein KFL_006620070 [Klebsormidium nitens]|eukprot:GAQ90612.1 hypothetical protein KFL_006620070 [Klebsormidium nitens]